jgi:hypothetical protein
MLSSQAVFGLRLRAGELPRAVLMGVEPSFPMVDELLIHH